MTAANEAAPGDAAWMRMALTEARRGLGLTSPNPAVGAVIVKEGRLLGTGWHRKAGGPHAEVEALRAATDRFGPAAIAGADIFVTLEPCSTTGRTPPCTDALIAAGLRRVVWGATDPFPAHAGRARTILEAAGMEVCAGILEDECREVLAPFAKRVRTGLPYVILKSGISLDGRITRPAGEGQWLTSPEARADAMRLRIQCDAIIAGAETIRQDNPALTVRGPDVPDGKPQPWRVILTRSGKLPAEATVFTDNFRDRTLVMQGQSFDAVLRDLAARGVLTVLIEGGGGVAASALTSGCVDEIIFYTAPLISGSGRPVIDPSAFAGSSVALKFTDWSPIGPDLRIRAIVLPEPA